MPTLCQKSRWASDSLQICGTLEYHLERWLHWRSFAKKMLFTARYFDETGEAKRANGARHSARDRAELARHHWAEFCKVRLRYQYHPPLYQDSL